MPLIETIFKVGEAIVEVVQNQAIGRKRKIKALTLLQSAVNSTRVFLQDQVDNTEAYQPNEDLSKKWLDAFEAINDLDPELGLELHYKSLFWVNPKKWIKRPQTLSLIPRLKDLDEYIQGQILSLNKK